MSGKLDRETLTGYCVAGLLLVAVVGIIRGIVTTNGGVALLAAAIALGIVVWLLENRA